MAVALCCSRSFAQTTSGSTRDRYFGFDLGGTYNWYSGGSNFFYPVGGSEPDGSSVSSLVAFNNLGHGIGYLFGFKGGRAFSNLFDLEVKLRYLTNYSTSKENNAIIIFFPNGSVSQAPVINSYSLSLNNLDGDFLAHLKFSKSWYAAGGVSWSALVFDRLSASQSKNGGVNWVYPDQNTGRLSADTSVSVSQLWSDFFSIDRVGLLVGGGTVLPFGIGSTMFDAELLVSIPLTDWLQSSGENLVNADAANLGLPSVTFPKLWYASLTIGMRFPFGGISEPNTSTGEE